MATHIFHYNTHAEKRYFLGHHRDLYDMIALNGNIVSHTPQGVASFIAMAGKNFYIDPQTHAFQHSTINLKRDISNKEKGEKPCFQFKPSIKRLAEDRLSGPFADVINNDEPIRSKDFFDDKGNINNDVITHVAEKVTDFQQNFLSNELDEEAKEFIGEETDLSPNFIIAPYFYLSSRDFSKWLEINICFYRKTKDIVKNNKVFLALVISREILNFRDDDIIKVIDNLKPDGILLWIDEYSEEELGIEEIKKYINFLEKLKNSTDKIYNNHGGYLSILLCHDDINNLLDGVGHSANYGESRSVIPVGGGIPMARFYFPSIHSRLRFGDALGIIKSKNWLSSKETYRNNICQCSYCTKLISEKDTSEKDKDTVDDAFLAYGESFIIKSRRRSGTIVSLEYPTKEAKEAAACHYIYNKKHEFDKIRNISLSDLLDNMDNTYNDLYNFVGDELIGHLYNWHDVLKKKLAK